MCVGVLCGHWSAVDAFQAAEVLCEGVGQEQQVQDDKTAAGQSVEPEAGCTKHDQHQEEDQEQEHAKLGVGEEGVQASIVELLSG